MHISAWLATTARREARRVRWRERGSAFTPGNQEITTEEILDTALLPDEVLVRLEEQHKIRTAVAALEDRCRKLLTLLFYQPDPPPYTEIAVTIGVTAGSIGPTRARCLQKLRRLLDESGSSPCTFSWLFRSITIAWLKWPLGVAKECSCE